MKSRDAYKTIGEVCDIVGLVDSETGKRKTHVLRFWEKHFNELKPSLVYKGRRYYSNQNIEYIKKIKKLLREDGYTIKGSKKVLTIKNYSVDSTSDVVTMKGTFKIAMDTPLRTPKTVPMTQDSAIK